MYNMIDLVSLLGILAGFFTTSSSIPQAIKIIKTKKTRDISLVMYCLVTLGIILWIIYGVIIKNIPIILANVVSFMLVFTILVFKIKYK